MHSLSPAASSVAAAPPPLTTSSASGWTRLQRLCFVLCLVPAVWMAFAWSTGTLGVNAMERLLRVSGRCALLLLLLTLATGPLRQFSQWLMQRVQAPWGRRIADWNGLLEVRRQLGLQAFAYALVHMLLYLWLDAGFSLQVVLEEIGLGGPMLAGWLAFGCLLVPALISNDRARRALGAWWPRLQWCAYLAGLSGALHYGLQAKLAALWPWPETAVMGLLLAWRLLQACKGRGETLVKVSAVRLRRWRGLPQPPA